MPRMAAQVRQAEIHLVVKARSSLLQIARILVRMIKNAVLGCFMRVQHSIYKACHASMARLRACMTSSCPTRTSAISAYYGLIWPTCYGFGEAVRIFVQTTHGINMLKKKNNIRRFVIPRRNHGRREFHQVRRGYWRWRIRYAHLSIERYTAQR